jgi:autotransporter adhesin
MNTIYSKVWNPSLGAVVVASELATGQRKGRNGIARKRGIAAIAALALAAVFSPAHADVCTGTFAAGQTPTATTDSMACGQVAAATGSHATAVGNNTTATGDDSTAVGYAAQATGKNSTALGDNSKAKANNSVALGQNSVASEANTVSVGRAGAERRITNVADAENDHDAVNKEQLDAASDQAATNLTQATRYLKVNGRNDGSDDALAMGGNSVAIGASTLALADNSIALGTGSGVDTHSTGTIVIGNGAKATDGVDANGNPRGSSNTVVIGNDALAFSGAQNGVAIGYQSALAQNSFDAVAIGTRSIGYGQGSVALGTGTYSLGAGSTAIGGWLDANGDGQLPRYGSSGGETTWAYGKASNAYGAAAIAFGDYATALGTLSYAGGSQDAGDGALSGSVAVGYKAFAAGDGTVAIGRESLTQHDGGTAVGYSSVAYGEDSVALGHGAVAANTQDIALGSNAWAGGGFGTRNMAIGNGAIAGNPDADLDDPTQDVNDAIALGANAQAGTSRAQAMGVSAAASGEQSVAVGNQAYASGDYTTAVGGASFALGTGASAMGNGATAATDFTTAVGFDASAGATNSVALGANSFADRANSVSVGSTGNERQITNVAAGTAGTDAVNVDQMKAANQYEAYGPHDGPGGGINGDYAPATATGVGAVAVGMNSVAGGVFGTALGMMARANNSETLALGGWSDAEGFAATAVGGSAKALGNWSVALGAHASTPGSSATAVGGGATAFSENGTALGNAASVATAASNSVALGAGSRATIANTISVGTVGNERRIVNVAAGTADTDAVNVSQLRDAGLVDAGGNTLNAVAYDSEDRARVNFAGTNGTVLANVAAGTHAGEAINVQQFNSLAATIGGGLSMGSNGLINTPNFAIQGNTYYNVGDALTAINGAIDGTIRDINGLDSRVGSLEGGATANVDHTAISASVTRVEAQAAPVAAAVSPTIASDAGGAQINNLAAGTAATDAVNKGQLDSATSEAIASAKSYADGGDATTLSSANAYTDSKLGGMVTSQNFDAFRNKVNDQFHAVNTRMDRVGAMGSALAGMAGAIAAADHTDNRVSAAAGGYKGQGALAVGYAHAIPGNGAVLLGGSIAGGGESTATVGVSIGW